MSRAKDALSIVLEVVSNETDMDAERIMGRRGDAETVDARWICVKLMSELGFYAMRIAEAMGITPRYVRYILTDFEDRIDECKMMRSDYERARKRLGKAIETICY